MTQAILKSLLEESRIKAAGKKAKGMHPADIAEALRDLPLMTQERFIMALPHDLAASVLEEMDLSEEATIVGNLNPQKAAEILKHMFTDEATDVLMELEEDKAKELLALMNQFGQELQELMEYKNDTSGGLMATEYITINEDLSVGEVLTYLRKAAPSAESAYYIYVVKTDRTLLGVVSLRELVVSSIETKVNEIMEKDIVKVPENMDQEEVARLFEKYGFLVLPVIDEEEKIVGVITVDDVLDVARQEATEDIHKSGSIRPLRDEYSNTSVLTLFGKRIGWLVGLIFVNLISSGIMATFEKTLSSAIVLAFFIPLLIDTGGNTGSQSATLIVRALVTGDIKLSHWAQTLAKELLVGTLLGLTLGLAGYVLGWFRGDVIIGIVVALTMIIIVLVSNVIGMLLPFVLTRLKLDPAVASSPLITSIADAVGLTVYFSIATWLLRI